MDFGKSYRIGNFSVVKLSRSLCKKEIARLRDDAGIPEEMRKHLTRGSLPYIKVRAISGIWAIEWCAGTEMFNLLDGIIGGNRHDEPDKPNGTDGPDMELIDAVKGLLSRMSALCSIVGDKEMNADLTKALSDFLGRRGEKDKPNELNEPDEPNGTDGADKPNGANEPDRNDEADETNRADRK